MMTDKPKTEDEIIKEVHRLCNDIVLLATHEPSKEGIMKYIGQTTKNIEENIFYSKFGTK